MELIAVMRAFNEENNESEIYLMRESTILNVEAIFKKGIKWIFAVEKAKAPDACDCGAKIKNITDIDDEPASVEYDCGLLVLRDYAQAIYRHCKNEPRRCA